MDCFAALFDLKNIVVMVFRHIVVMVVRHIVAMVVAHIVVIRLTLDFSKTSLRVLQRPNSSGPFKVDLLHHFHYLVR